MTESGTFVRTTPRRVTGVATVLLAVMAAVLSITVAPASAVSGAVPTFSKPVATPDGFVVSVNNYSEEYVWQATTSAGTLKKGTPQGQTWVLTVTGLKPGQSATITVTASMPGLEDSSASVSGTAIAGDNPPTEQRAAASLQFTGTSVALSAAGKASLDALIDGLPDGASVVDVVLWVTTSRHPTRGDVARAKARVTAISSYLADHGITREPITGTPKAKKAGRAKVTVVYLP